MIVVRYADDIVLGFQHQSDAERFWKELARTIAQVRTGAASGQDPADGVRPLRGREPQAAWSSGSPRPSTSWASRIFAVIHSAPGKRLISKGSLTVLTATDDAFRTYAASTTETTRL